MVDTQVRLRSQEELRKLQQGVRAWASVSWASCRFHLQWQKGCHLSTRTLDQETSGPGYIKAAKMTTAQVRASSGICLSCSFARGQHFPDRTSSFEGSLFVSVRKLPSGQKKHQEHGRNVRAKGASAQGQGTGTKMSSHAASIQEHAAKAKPELMPKAGKSTDFMRFTDMGEAGTELQTAIVTYTKEGEWWEGLVGRRPLEVDLVACVHIADKSYYQGLQKEFQNYDRVLYEVRPNTQARVRAFELWLDLLGTWMSFYRGSLRSLQSHCVFLDRLGSLQGRHCLAFAAHCKLRGGLALGNCNA